VSERRDPTDERVEASEGSAGSGDGAATADRAVPGEDSRSRPRTVALVAGLFLLSAAGASYEIVPASVTPLVRESLGIGPTAAGWIVSVTLLTAVVASVPVGAALDRWSVRVAVAGAAASLLLAGLWGWWAASAGAYPSLLGSRVLGGLGFLTVWNAGASVVGRAVTADLRATAVGLFTASGPAGFALGQFGGPLVARAWGWPAVLVAFPAVAVPGVALFLFGSRGRRVDAASDPPDRAALGRLLRDPGVWTLCALCFLAFSLYLFLNSWLPSYLVEELAVDIGTAGLLTALFPAVGILARAGSGAVSDRLFGGRRRPVAVLGFLATTPAVAGFLFTTRIPAVAGLVVVAGFGVQLALGLLFSYVVEVVPRGVETTAVSMLTSVGLFGAFVAPIGAGAMIEAAGYRPAFGVAVVVGATGVAVALRAPEAG